MRLAPALLGQDRDSLESNLLSEVKMPHQIEVQLLLLATRRYVHNTRCSDGRVHFSFPKFENRKKNIRGQFHHYAYSLVLRVQIPKSQKDSQVISRKKLTDLLYCCTSPDFGLYAVCSSLVKLTPGVNFTNILWAAFLYKSVLHSFYVLTVWVCIFFGFFGLSRIEKIVPSKHPKFLNLYVTRRYEKTVLWYLQLFRNKFRNVRAWYVRLLVLVRTQIIRKISSQGCMQFKDKDKDSVTSFMDNCALRYRALNGHIKEIKLEKEIDKREREKELQW